MRRARVDANHGEIVKALRQVGASVQSLARQGEGCPDLIVGWRGQNFLIEVKSRGGKPNQAQNAWAEKWRGLTHVVWSVDDALTAIGAKR